MGSTTHVKTLSILVQSFYITVRITIRVFDDPHFPWNCLQFAIQDAQLKRIIVVENCLAAFGVPAPNITVPQTLLYFKTHMGHI